ncbi:MAG: PH domain-containing protein, partial [bacterium]|nr:PH domain-containing protein [bacterium]
MSKSRYVELATDKHKKKFGHYLTDGEEMVIFTTVSKAYLITKFILHFFVASLITMPLFYLVHRFFNYGFLGTTGTALLLALVYAALRYYFTKEGIQYILTNRRVIVQIGYFKVTLYSASYNKITHIEVDQSIPERLFYKHGRLIINTSGMDNKPITLNYLSSPIEFKNIMERLIAQERHKYG